MVFSRELNQGIPRLGFEATWSQIWFSMKTKNPRIWHVQAAVGIESSVVLEQVRRVFFSHSLTTSSRMERRCSLSPIRIYSDDVYQEDA